MNDYTHKRYLVRNSMTGETRTVTHKIGSRSYDPPLRPHDEIMSCIGGFRNPNAATPNNNLQEDMNYE